MTQTKTSRRAGVARPSPRLEARGLPWPFHSPHRLLYELGGYYMTSLRYVAIIIAVLLSTSLQCRAEVPSPSATQTSSAAAWKKIVGAWSCKTGSSTVLITYTSSGYEDVGPEHDRAWFENSVLVTNEGEGYTRERIEWTSPRSFQLIDSNGGSVTTCWHR